MTSMSTANPFPAAWIVLAAVAPVIAFAGVLVAGESGVRMTTHGSSAFGQVLEWTFVTICVAALVIESGAILFGIRAMWKFSQARSLANVAALLFGIFVTGTFVAFATGASWLR